MSELIIYPQPIFDPTFCIYLMGPLRSVRLAFAGGLIGLMPEIVHPNQARMQLATFTVGLKAEG